MAERVDHAGKQVVCEEIQSKPERLAESTHPGIVGVLNELLHNTNTVRIRLKNLANAHCEIDLLSEIFVEQRAAATGSS